MSKKLRILLLQKSDEEAAAVIPTLEEAGYECDWERVDSLEVFLKCLDKPNYDLVISDCSLPPFDGFTALGLFREREIDIPYILISEANTVMGSRPVIESVIAHSTDHILKENIFNLPNAVKTALRDQEVIRQNKKAEAKMRLQVTALQAAANGIVITDRDGKITWVNPAFTKLTGYTISEAVGQNPRILKSGKHDDRLYRDLWKTVSAGRVWHGELENRRKDGTTYFEEQTITPVLDGNGQITNFIAIKQDVTERRLTEEALLATREKFETIFRAAPGGMILATLPERKIAEVNDKFSRVTGIERENALGKTTDELGLWVDPAKHANAVDLLMERGFVEDCELELKRPNGEIRHGLVSAYIVEILDKKWLLGVFNDITEWKVAEIEHVNNAERLRLAVRGGNIGLWEWDIRTNEVLFSSEWKSQLGFTDDEIANEFREWETRVHPDDLAATLEVLRTYTSDPTGIYEAEFRLRHKDGTWRWIYAHGELIESRDGTMSRLVGCHVDLTRWKRAEIALKESEERYRDLVENALDIIYTEDLEGNFTSVNRAASDLLGYPASELSNRNMLEVVAPEYVEMSKQMDVELLAGKSHVAYELEIIKKNGSRVAVEVKEHLIRENGVPIGIQGIARDITERKQLEKQLQQSQKMEGIGVLAGGIAHDFNNLLTAINGHSDLVLLRMSDDDPLRTNVEQVRKAGDRAAELTKQLLAFSRKQMLRPRVHNVNGVITDLESMLRRIIPENIELRTRLALDVGMIKADPGQLEQVFLNLIVNARDAMPEGGTITIETKNITINSDNTMLQMSIGPGQFVEISISDTGTGIDERTMSQMFEPFFTTKDVGKGTGLGLSTVDGIIKQSGGDIDVASVVGEGTTFRVYLPLVMDSPSSFDTSDVEIGKDHRNETILLVEDEEVLRRLIREILEDCGYEVLDAADGEEALSVVAEFEGKVDLLLTDVVMPRMSGGELSQRIAKLVPDIKVFYMSGYNDDLVAQSGILECGTEFIQKPFSPDKLSAKVRNFLDS